jgi:hypothetical protein
MFIWIFELPTKHPFSKLVLEISPLRFLFVTRLYHLHAKRWRAIFSGKIFLPLMTLTYFLIFIIEIICMRNCAQKNSALWACAIASLLEKNGGETKEERMARSITSGLFLAQIID